MMRQSWGNRSKGTGDPCEGLLECLHELIPRDRECNHVMSKSNDLLTIGECSSGPTASHSTQQVLARGRSENEQINFYQAASCYIDSPIDPEKMALAIGSQLNNGYEKTGQCVKVFGANSTLSMNRIRMRRSD